MNVEIFKLYSPFRHWLGSCNPTNEIHSKVGFEIGSRFEVIQSIRFILFRKRGKQSMKSTRINAHTHTEHKKLY